MEMNKGKTKNSNSEKWAVKKFDRDYNEIFKEVDPENEGKLNYLKTNEFLHYMGFLTPNSSTQN